MKASTRSVTILWLASFVPTFGLMKESESNEISPIQIRLQAEESVDFELGQAWLAKEQQLHTEGLVQLFCREDALEVRATLTDRDVYTLSGNDNQPMWELGDVFEMFIQIAGNEDYFELHITPNDTRFHAHKPNVPGTDPSTGEWQPIEHWLIDPIGFVASSTTKADGWNAMIEVPPALLGLESFAPGTQLRVSFARYDGGPDREPTLTASAPHRTPSFHQPADWQPITLIQ